MATAVLPPVSYHVHSDGRYKFGDEYDLTEESFESGDSGYSKDSASNTHIDERIVTQQNGIPEETGVCDNIGDNRTQHAHKREIAPNVELEVIIKHDTNERTPLQGVDNISTDSGVCEMRETQRPSGTDANNHLPLIPQNDDLARFPDDDAEKRTVHIRSPDKSFCLKTLIIFSILDVLLFVTIFVVAFGIPCSDSPAADQSPSRHCLKCMDVYLTQDDKHDNIYDFIIEDDNCCSENETLLIQKYVIKRYRSDQAKASAERGFPERTAIHLDLDLEDKNSKQEGLNQELKWTTPSLMYGDLSLSEDRTRIKIGRTGLYYISPKVVFNDDKEDIGAVGLDPMSLQLYRERKSDPQLLLETKETHCAHSDTSCAKPSSGQGVFKMEKEDIVVVKVTKPCGLVLNNSLNHLDMYMI